MESEKREKTVSMEEVAKRPVKPQLKKHMSSTFTPMIGGYMSDEQVKLHVEHQLSLEQKKYEPEEEPIAEEQENSKKRKVKFKKDKNKNVNSDEEDEREEKRREYREGLHDRMLEDLELLRDYYKRIYKRALKEKVSNQHKEFKDQHQKALAKERQLKEKEEIERHKVIIRLPKSKVLNDQTYKQDIKETVYHKIIKLEHQLKKQGYLSKVSEIKAFWDFILVPGNLEQILEKGKLSWEDILEYEKSHRDSLMADPVESPQKWTTSNIDKMIADNSRPAWRSSKHTRSNLFTPSGLTDNSTSQNGRDLSPVSSPSRKKSVPKTLSSEALTFEQKFPKVEFPPLAAYSLVFGDQEPDPEEIERELEIQRKEEAKRDTRSKLLTMFSHALANRTATQRLIERNEEFSFDQLVETSSVKELMYHDTERKPPKVLLTRETLQAHERLTSTQHEKKKKGHSRKSSSKEPAHSPSPSHRDTGTDNEEVLSREYKRLPPIAAVPLSMQVLEQTNPTQEAKGLSTLWVNPF